MPFVKLDCGILDSSLWVEPSDTRICWITMLAMADSNGLVEATAPGIARKACIPIESCRQALNTFESPDDDSRTKSEDGRRIQRVDGGYQILNYTKYREKDYTNAVRQARHRNKSRNAVTPVTKVVHGNGSNTVTSLPVTQAEAEAYTEAEKQKQLPLSEPNGSDRSAEISELTKQVWVYYLSSLHRDEVKTKLTAARQAMFKNRLREQWKDLAEPRLESALAWAKEIVDKLAADPFSNGQNDRHTKYVDWEHMFDSRKRVEKWLNR